MALAFWEKNKASFHIDLFEDLHQIDPWEYESKLLNLLPRLWTRLQTRKKMHKLIKEKTSKTLLLIDDSNSTFLVF